MAQIQDMFEQGESSQGFSTKYTRPGESFGGIILPHPDNGAPYVMRQRTNIDSGLPLWFNNGKVVTLSEPEAQAAGCADSPVPVAIYRLLTEFSNYELLSATVTQSYKDDGVEDNGMRSWFCQGRSQTKALRDAVRKAKAPGGKPEVGGTIKITLVREEPVPGQKYAEKIWSVEYALPTASSKAKVEEWVSKHQATDVVNEGGVPDTFAGNDGDATDGDAPPF